MSTENSKPNFRSGIYRMTQEEVIYKTKQANGEFYTRFPPEPNGSLHLGHAKALQINAATALEHGGHWILRLDDTNPETASERHVMNIREMIAWLGYHPHKVTYSSDYFADIYLCALKLLNKGLAYVCFEGDRRSLSPRERSQLPQSPTRGSVINKNMREFAKMATGYYGKGQAVLRLKMQTISGFRDPVAYRINYHPHFRTKNTWKIYPTYDFAHCICDALEGVAISLCSNEFESHREIYEWVLKQLDLPKIQQFEYSRMKIKYNLLSKSKIQSITSYLQLEDDPRLLTLAALRRRGVPPETIHDFIAQELQDFDSLMETCRKHLLPVCKRTSVIISPLKCNIINEYSFNLKQETDCPTFVETFNHIYINKFDFRDTQLTQKFYLTPTSPVVLNRTHILIEVKVIHRNVNEEIDTIDIIMTKTDSPTKKKYRKIAWLCDPIQATLCIYDQLLKVPKLSDTDSIIDCLQEYKRYNILIDKSLHENVNIGPDFKYGQVFQAERFGYICVDKESTAESLHFNMTCLLRMPEQLRRHIDECGEINLI